MKFVGGGADPFDDGGFVETPEFDLGMEQFFGCGFVLLFDGGDQLAGALDDLFLIGVDEQAQGAQQDGQEKRGERGLLQAFVLTAIAGDPEGCAEYA